MAVTNDAVLPAIQTEYTCQQEQIQRAKRLFQHQYGVASQTLEMNYARSGLTKMASHLTKRSL
ncbi:hypothetical protein DLR60_17710 [Vibrio tarriae]|nr:hypothetical protein DLR60_17710 [Vibrio tarriae]